jgi:diguanylate cyclase (GGDEF)-like protein/PAS domain S-box-containing protein
MFEDGPAGIWVVGADFKTLEVNGAVCRMLGYTATELRGLTFADVTHPDDVDADTTLAQRLISGELKTYNMEKRSITKGGETIWVGLTATAVRTEDGEFRYAIGIVNDISERRAAEAALAERERQLAHAQTLARVGSWTWHPRTSQIHWSDEAYRILGLEPQSVPADFDLLFRLVHPDDVRQLQASIDSMMRTGEPLALDLRVLRPGGAVVWVRFRTEVVMGPEGPELLTGSIQDITESRRLEESLTTFAAIVQSSDNAIVSLTPDCIFTSWNPAAEALYGYSADEAVGRSVALLTGGGDPDGAGARPSILQNVARGQRIDNHETQVVRKDGTVVPISLSASPIHDDHGAVVGISSIAYDITERRRARESLSQAHDDLARSVAELGQHNREVTLINEMGDLLQSCSSLDDVSKVIRRYARQLFPAQSGAVSVIAASRNLLETVASWGHVAGAEVFTPHDCWAIRRGRMHRVEGEDDEVICPHLGNAAPSGYVCVPMMAQGEALGLVHLEAPVIGQDDTQGGDAWKRLAVPVAEHLSLALANFKLRETLRNQSIRDPLTGLFNRRYMEESFERELARAARNKSSVAVLAIDVDHFKRFNDTFGHHAGDALLSGLGRLFLDFFRSEDISCRYGGEEFNIILPECSLASGRERAEGLRKAAKALQVAFRGQSYGGITLSVGLAVFPEDGGDGVTLLQRADEALYRAKAEGRDRVVVAGPEG